MADVVADDLQVKDTPWVDARQYGPGTLTDETLQAAIDAINLLANKNKTLLISPDRATDTGQWNVNANVIFPPNINVRFEEGAFLRITNNAIVTFKGTLDAPLSRIFRVVSGKVHLDSANLDEVHPEWWGAKGNGAADDAAEIQAALDAATSGVNSTRRRTVALLNKTYKVDSTLTIGCDLRGGASPLSGDGTVILYTGTTACLYNVAPYGNGTIIKNIRIEMQNNTNNDVYGILCENGHVYGAFENVQILCNSNPNVKHYGIRIKVTQPPPPTLPQYNAAGNRFVNLDIENPDIGLWIGDDSNPGQGKFNVILGGIILNAKKAAILLTGEENSIIGGDFSAATTGNVFLFSGGFDSLGAEITGGWCRNNSIVGTAMEIINAPQPPPIYHAIKIFADASISQVFNATSMRVSGLANFVTDNDTRQRWVAVRSNAAVEAREFFARGINALGNADPYNGSLTGGGPTGELTSDKAFAIRASTEYTPGMILLGTSNAPALFDSGLPVLSNGVTLLIGPGGRIYFAKLITATSAAEIANMDVEGNLTLQGGFQMAVPNGKFWTYGSDPYIARPNPQVGDIVWNTNPQDRIGWVCKSISPTIVWKSFGVIDP